jgi:hypothetical protein
MIYQGRPGLWDDWLQFQADMARARREEIARLEREALEKQEKIRHWIEIAAWSLVAVVVIVGTIALLTQLLSR